MHKAQEYLMGYWVGDGYTSLEGNHLRTKLCGTLEDWPRVEEGLEVLNLKTGRVWNQPNTWVNAPGVAFTRILQRSGFRLPCHSLTKHLPQELFELEIEAKAAILSGMWDADGHVWLGSKKDSIGGRVGYSTRASELAEALPRWLGTMGLETSTYVNGADKQICLRRSSLRRFHQLVQLNERKQRDLDQLTFLIEVRQDRMKRKYQKVS